MTLPDLTLLDVLKLLDDEADEDLVRVQKTVVDPQLDQLGQQVQHLGQVGQGMYNTGTADPIPGTGRSRYV